MFTSSPKADYSGIPQHQLQIADRIGIPIFDSELPHSHGDLILDGLIGYSLRGAPRGRAAELANFANSCDTPTLSLDVPSGIDTASGVSYEPSISASATLTLALPKAGLFSEIAIAQTGELYLGDISVPPSLYERMKLEVPASLFETSDIIRIVGNPPSLAK